MPADSPQRYQGEIVEWSVEKRCGFVRPRGSSQSDPLVFLPARSLANRTRVPKVGDVVLYETVTLDNSPKNRHLRTRLRAEKACFLGDEPQVRAETYRPPTILGGTYLAALGLASLLVREAFWILFLSLALSALALAQYGFDKAVAGKDRRRVPESNLHLVSLLGGWPGAALAQAIFRHKTQKRSFQSVFWVVIAMNIGATVAACAYFAAT